MTMTMMMLMAHTCWMLMCAQYFTCSQYSTWSRHYYYLCFGNENTGMGRWSKWAKLTQLVNGNDARQSGPWVCTPNHYALWSTSVSIIGEWIDKCGILFIKHMGSSRKSTELSGKRRKKKNEFHSPLPYMHIYTYIFTYIYILNVYNDDTASWNFKCINICTHPSTY